MKQVLLLSVLLLLFVTSTFAVGLSAIDLTPEFDAAPSLEKSFPFLLRTTTSRTLDYKVTIEGDLAKYFSATPAKMEQVSPGSEQWFSVEAKFPADLSDINPGLHIVRIGVLEGIPTSASGLSARTGVRTKIQVRVLHPTAFLVSSLSTPNVNENEDVTFSVRLENWGVQPIHSSFAVLEIIDPVSLEVLTSLETTKASVSPAGSNVVTAIFDATGFRPGLYKVRGVVHWDGKQDELESEFNVGTKDLVVENVTFEINPGAVGLFTVRLTSVWNDVLGGVNAKLEAFGSTFRTPTISIQPWQTSEVTGFVDASGVKLGEYPGNLTVFYDGLSKRLPVTVLVTKKETEDRFALSFSSNQMIAFVAVVLIVSNLILWLFIVRTRRKRHGR